ncbi:Tyrosine-protein kinase etk [Methylophilaceae bacterium]|nr:Tyrosine-protein kinase etk [Methylophilaceae bacterium]
MNITQFLLILRARFTIIVTVFCMTVLTALVASLIMPKAYKATAQVVLNYQGRDAITGAVAASQLSSGYLMTQIDIIKSHRLAMNVVDLLDLEKNARMKEKFIERTNGLGEIRSWIAGQLRARLEVSPARESSVLQLSFTSDDPLFSARVANAYANAYRELGVKLRAEPVQRAASYFSGQVKELRANLEQAESRLSKYQQDNGITSLDQQLDVESSRLNELSQQMVIAQAMAIESRSRQQNASSNPANSPDVAMNPVIQSLRVESAKAESRLAELAERLGMNHPQYQAAEAELTKTRSQLYAEISRTSNSIAGSASIHKQRENDLRAQLALQKEEVLKLNRTRDQLAVLQKDVEIAQKAMDAATQRFSQTSMEAQANQSDAAILTFAEPPGSPSSPKILLNVLLSVFVGGFLAVGLGLIAEMMDRRVRSSDDIAGLLKVPVVALINKKPRVTGMKLLPA